MRLVAAAERHLAAMVALSQALAGEDQRMGSIPVGSIGTVEQARRRLLGPNIVAAQVEEDEQGELAGLATVARYDAGLELSVMVAAAHRRRGVARQLVEELVRQLPAGVMVEAWVAQWNTASLAAMKALGFRPERTVEDGGQTVHVLTRET